MFEDESPNSAEYVYEKQSKGKVKLQRTLMICFYVVFVLAYFLFCYISRIIPLFAMAPIFLYILYLFTWRLVKYDCYWEFRSGELTAGTVRVGKTKKRVPVVKLRVKEALAIGPLNSISDLGEAKKIYDFSESPTSDKRIYVIFEKDGVRSALLIEATAKLGKLLAAFSKNADSVKGLQFHG